MGGSNDGSEQYLHWKEYLTEWSYDFDWLNGGSDSSFNVTNHAQ